MKFPALARVKQNRPALAFIAGVALATAFPNANQPWLAWLIPGLVLMLGLGQPMKAVLRIGFFAGLGFQLTSLHWLLLIPMPLHAVAAWLSLCVYLALFPAAWSWVCWRCAPGQRPGPANFAAEPAEFPGLANWKQRAAWALFCGAAWVAMEMGMARVLTGFPWNLLGVSQLKFLPLIQIASVAGVYGVGFLVAWTSVALALAVLASARSPGKLAAFVRELMPPALAVLAVMIFGCSRLSDQPGSNQTLKLALIQPAIPQPVIWDPNEKTNRFNKLLALSREALAHQPDVLVWPEAALPDLVSRSRATQEIITHLVRRHHVWMIFGGEDTGRKQSADGMEEIHHFNTAFLVNPAGDLVARYHKRRLVVFTEYMPAIRWLPFLKFLRESGHGFVAGTRLVPFRLNEPGANISMSICFEDVFPHLTRESVDSDTDFLLNLTNDAWCGESATQWQHAAAAAFRAVENGLPLVRCSNNGLTCWVDARGRMHAVHFPNSNSIYQPGLKLVQVPLRTGGGEGTRTFYHRFGDWFGWSCVAITIAATLWSLLITARRRDRSVAPAPGWSCP